MFHPCLNTSSADDLPDLHNLLITNGYYCFDNFVVSEGVDLLLNEVQSLIDNATPSSPYGVFYDSYNQIVLMNKVDKESDLLFDLLRHPKLLQLAEVFLGKPAMPLHVEYFSKPAKNSSPSPPHQDHVVYQKHFDDELAIAFWIALDEVHENSGALEFAQAPMMKLLPHTLSSVQDFAYELENRMSIPYVLISIPRGGCIVHHSYTVHQANVNESNKPHRALVFNYRGSPYLAHRKLQLGQ